MPIIKRIKRFWELSKKDKDFVDALDNLTDKQIMEIPSAGDGQAVFFGEGTKEEYEELKKEDSGMKGWYDRLKNL